jgi:hypothetical protein
MRKQTDLFLSPVVTDPDLLFDLPNFLWSAYNYGHAYGWHLGRFDIFFSLDNHFIAAVARGESATLDPDAALALITWHRRAVERLSMFPECIKSTILHRLASLPLDELESLARSLSPEWFDKLTKGTP